MALIFLQLNLIETCENLCSFPLLIHIPDLIVNDSLM